MKINKGDVILLCILLATLMFFGINEFNILAGKSQFDGSFTALFGVIFGGELLSFAVYKIGMAKYEGQRDVGMVKYDPENKNNVIRQIESDIQQLENVANAVKKGQNSNE